MAARVSTISARMPSQRRPVAQAVFPQMMRLTHPTATPFHKGLTGRPLTRPEGAKQDSPALTRPARRLAPAAQALQSLDRPGIVGIQVASVLQMRLGLLAGSRFQEGLAQGQLQLEHL